MGLILRNMSSSAGSQQIGVTGSFYLASSSNGQSGGFLSLPQMAMDNEPANAHGFLYVASSSTTPTNSSLWFRSDSGTDSDLIGGGAVDGAGKASRGTYWSDSNTVTYTDNWTFDGSAWNLDATTYEVDASSTIVLDSDSSVTIGGASLDIDADGGAIDVDATGAVSIDSSAASITVGAILADGQTLKLGKNGAAEMIFTPHGTPANEKISLVNTTGTADDAIKIDAEAGGLTLAAGNDSLHIDADGTDADALNIDSAGGIDVDAAAAVDILAATTLSAKGATGASLGDDTGTWEFDGDGVVTETGMASLSVTPSGAITLTAGAASTWSTSAGALVIDGAGGLTLDSDGTDAVNLGTEAAAKNITIGNDASAKVDVNALIVELDSAGTIVTNSVTTTDIVATTALTLTAGATSTWSTSAGNLIIDAAGTLTLDSDGTDAVNLGTEAAAKTVTVGNAATAEVELNALLVDINAGTNGLTMNAAGASNLVTSAGALTITSDEAATWSTVGGKLTIKSGDSGEDIGISGQTTTLKGKLNVDEAATFDTTVSITGNLFVAGTTTTVSSSNMLVKDPIAAFGIAASSVSGTPTPGPVGDRGFAFPMEDAYAGSPVFFWDNSGAVSSGVPQGTFRLAYANTSGSATSITKVGALGLDVGAITATGVTDSALTDNRVVIAGTSGVLEDSSNLTFDGSDLSLGSAIGLVFGAAGEKIEGDGDNLNITSGGELDMTVTGLIDINGSANLDVDITGTVDVLASSTFSIDGTGASNVTATSGNLTLSTGTSGNVVVSSAAAVDVDADGGALSLDGSGGINIGTEADVAIDVDSSTFDLDASGAVTIDASAGGVSIDAAAGAVNVTAAASSLTLAGQTLDIDATSGAFNIAGTAASTVTTSGGALSLDGQTGLNLQENGTSIVAISDARAVTVNNHTTWANTPSSTYDLDAAGAITIDGASVTVGGDGDTGAINITAGATSKWVTDTGGLQIKNTGTAGGYANYIVLSGGFESSVVLQTGDNTDGSFASTIDFMRGDGDASAGTASTLWSWNGANLSSTFDENFDRGYANISGTLNFKGNSTGNTALYANNSFNFLEVTGSSGNLKLGADGAVTTLASTATLVEGTAKLQFYDNGGTEFIQADASNNLTINAGGDITYDAVGANHNFQVSDTTLWAMGKDSGDVGFTIFDDANQSDYFDINVAANGETTLSTVDDDAMLADFNLNIDGDINFDADGGNIYFLDNGTTLLDFDLANSVLLPQTDNAFDLGSSSKRFANIYTGDLHLANNRGNYTLVEEEEMLTIRNNRTGKWYKFAMEEIDPTGRDEGMNGGPPLLAD